MKKITLLSNTIIAIVIITFFTSSPDTDHSSKNGQAEKPNDWFFRQRAYPSGQINHTAYLSALKQREEMLLTNQERGNRGQWEFAGPVNIGGRITDVEMDPTDLSVAYLGAASGGVFKSTDQGVTWFPVFDTAWSLSIGDIALAPSNPDVIYVGTGESNAGGGSLAYDGVGVYRSDDAGQTWQYVGLEESGSIGRIVVSAHNPDVAYVASMGSLFANTAERGVYKTTDGGISWENVLFISDSTGAIDLAINPDHPDTIYAAMWERIRRPNYRTYGGPTCGIYRSYDGGQSWEELTNGLPTLASQKGRIGIDISVSNPNILYAIYADRTGYFNGVYKSTDNGDTWIHTNDGSLSDCFVSYGWWFGRIKVDPVDPDNVFVIGFDIYRTQNGGNSWSNQSDYSVHVDQHAVYIHPLDNNFVLLGNDGGLYRSTNGGTSWTWNQNIPITQFYTCELDYQYPERLYGGAQDNGTNRTMTGNLNDWTMIYGGDGFNVLVDPENNNYVYAEYQYGNLARSTNGGSYFYDATSGISGSDRFNWNSPVVFDPSDPSVLYFGTNRLYRSVDHAASWTAISGDLTDGNGSGNLVYHTITTIGVSPVNPDLVYTGSDDGNVYVTDDGSTFQSISDGLPKRWVTRVAADPIEENIVYVTLSGYRWDEYQPHVFVSNDYGNNWTDISSNLPESPVNDIIISPNDNSVIFVATDMGVYVTYNQGESWQVLGDNLPNVVVDDLVYHQPTNKLLAATYGRSMYTYDLEQDPQTSVHENKTDMSAVVYPNPFSDKTTISVKGIHHPENIFIYNLTGKLVTVLQIGANGSAIWNGRNRQGMKVNKGAYFCRIQSGGQFISKKIILQ
jgi:photosystem II stability/assembly factor-like uncharacterized protein